jgi:hypothetical protein
MIRNMIQDQKEQDAWTSREQDTQAEQNTPPAGTEYRTSRYQDKGASRKWIQDQEGRRGYFYSFKLFLHAFAALKGGGQHPVVTLG